MIPCVGAVVFPTWQAVLLIVLSFGSLGVALYCLFFMVPLKSFVHHIDSLGGGMEGIRSYVDGIRSDIENRIQQLEGDIREQLDAHRQELSERVSSVTQVARDAEAALRELDQKVQKLQADLREDEKDVRQVLTQMDSARSEITELRNDLKTAEEKMRGTLNQMVADSYRKVESTVISALGALQDQLVQPADASSHRNGHPFAQDRGSRESSGRGNRKAKTNEDKIISAEPLFGEPAPRATGACTEEEVPETEEQGTNT